MIRIEKSGMRESKDRVRYQEAGILICCLYKFHNEFQKLGFDPPGLSECSQVPEDTVTQREKGVVAYVHLISLFRAVLNASGDPSLGLRVGREVHIGVLGALGYAMMSAPTLGKAMETFVDYHKIVLGDLLGLSFYKENNRMVYEVSAPKAMIRELIFMVNFLSSGFAPLVKQIADIVLEPRHVCFTFPKPSDLTEYQASFNCPVSFYASSNRLIFDAQFFETPLPHQDNAAFTACEGVCRQTLLEFESTRSLSGCISRLIYKKITAGLFFNINEIARELGCSVRTLRRKLKSEGTSFRQLKDQVRKELAIKYLKEAEVTVQQVGEILGFSEATNFRKAFTRWTGLPPAAFKS